MTAASQARESRANITRPDLSWQAKAQCRGEDITVFFGPSEGEDRETQRQKKDREAEAKWICRGCSARSECLDYAVETNQKFGTWGGLNEDERNSERRRRARKQAVA